MPCTPCYQLIRPVLPDLTWASPSKSHRIVLDKTLAVKKARSGWHHTAWEPRAGVEASSQSRPVAPSTPLPIVVNGCETWYNKRRFGRALPTALPGGAMEIDGMGDGLDNG